MIRHSLQWCKFFERNHTGSLVWSFFLEWCAFDRTGEPGLASFGLSIQFFSPSATNPLQPKNDAKRFSVTNKKICFNASHVSASSARAIVAWQAAHRSHGFAQSWCQCRQKPIKRNKTKKTFRKKGMKSNWAGVILWHLKQPHCFRALLSNVRRHQAVCINCPYHFDKFEICLPQALWVGSYRVKVWRAWMGQSISRLEVKGRKDFIVTYCETAILDLACRKKLLEACKQFRFAFDKEYLQVVADLLETVIAASLGNSGSSLSEAGAFVNWVKWLWICGI